MAKFYLRSRNRFIPVQASLSNFRRIGFFPRLFLQLIHAPALGKNIKLFLLSFWLDFKPGIKFFFSAWKNGFCCRLLKSWSNSMKFLVKINWNACFWMLFAFLTEREQGYKIALKMNFLTKASRPIFTYTYRLRIKNWTNVCASVCLCVCVSVCPRVTEFRDSLTGALAAPILTEPVSFDQSRCPPGHRKVSFDLVNYTKSYLRKTI